MAGQPSDVDVEILHQLELVRRDVGTMNQRLGELVSAERYTLEQANQNEKIVSVAERVTTLERARETMRHMIASAFVLPLLVAVVFYLITQNGA
jgi:hypothetical protein